jgi:hypothetical protein
VLKTKETTIHVQVRVLQHRDPLRLLPSRRYSFGIWPYAWPFGIGGRSIVPIIVGGNEGGGEEKTK